MDTKAQQELYDTLVEILADIILNELTQQNGGRCTAESQDVYR